METFKHGVERRIVRVTLAAAAIVCMISGSAFAAVKGSTPSPQELAELAKFAAYNGNIEVITANEGNGLHEFLHQNAGKTVFIETAVLRYKPTPEGVTAETRNQIPPTDRFENSAFQKCWGEEARLESRIESGETGFPLPLDQADIEAGCATRIKIELAEGDYGPNVDRVAGFDKFETRFIGFFAVKKETLAGGKTLYRLTEAVQPEETAAAFYKHATKKDRPLRALSVKDVQPASGKAE